MKFTDGRVVILTLQRPLSSGQVYAVADSIKYRACARSFAVAMAIYFAAATVQGRERASNVSPCLDKTIKNIGFQTGASFFRF